MIREKQVFNLTPDNDAPYSDATVFNNMAFISGQMSIDPQTGLSRHGNIEEQSELTIQNLLAVAKGLGASAEDFLSITTYLADMADYEGYNKVYVSHFADKKPARCTVTVNGLYDSLKIEMTAVIAIPS